MPIRRIFAFCVAALFVLFIWAFYGDFIHNIAWDLRHYRTATFRGQTLQVPWFWREEKWTNYNEFELTRSYLWMPLTSSVRISYENISPADVQGKVDGTLGGYAKLTQSLGGYLDRDDSYDSHFICLEEGAKASDLESVTCFSRDGRWSVQMIRTRESRSDFEMILRGVNSMGTPSK